MRLFRIPLIGVLVLLTAATTWAQLSTAQLSGRVTDDSGAVLPGVTVTVTQTDTGLVRSVVTDETGSYVLPNLPTGPYRLEATLQGFRTYAQTGIVLQVAAAPVINVALAIGSLEETVSVEAAAPLVDVKSAGIGDVVDNERIVSLPLQGRNVTDLIVLAGAAVKTDATDEQTNDSRYVRGGVRISVAGGLPVGVSYLLDGASHNDPHSNRNLPMPFPDALQEFRVATSGLSAQNGVHGAASVNAVTKSGTNTLHGNAFEFLRDRRLNAKSPFAGIGPDGKRRDDGLLRNQFGGTLGGPIMRDRLFFFGGYQGTPIRRQPADQIRFVPTAQMLAGDFTAIASPACAGRQVNLSGGFVGNRIDPALFNPAAMNLARRFPVATDPCGQITFSATDNSNEGQAIGRVDYQQSSNHTIFGRYMNTFFTRNPPYQGEGDNALKLTALAATATGGVRNLTHALTLGDTLVLGPTAVNAVRVAFNRTDVERFNTPSFGPSDLGIKLYPFVPGQFPSMTVTGAFVLPAGATKSEFVDSFYQVSDDLTLVRGRHQLGVGGTVSYTKAHSLQTSRSGGQYTINGSLTGLALADFLLGRVATFEHGPPQFLPVHSWYMGVYAQDSWRATERVTVNLGLRWEPYFGLAADNDAVSIFDLDRFRRGLKSTVFVNAPAGFIYRGDAEFPDGQTGLNKQWTNFSPRAGVAWDMTGDGRMALRASYALTYDFLTTDYHSINASAPPFGNRVQFTDPVGRMNDPYAPGQDPGPIVTNSNSVFPAFGIFGTMDPDINSPRLQNWNVTLERQIGRDWGVAVSYLGNYADRLWAQTALNPGIFMGTGPCTLKNGVTYPVCSTVANLNFRRVLYQENQDDGRFIGPLDLNDDIGWQEYHGLKLSAQRRAAGGLSINGNYTLSRCIGTDTTNTFNQANSGYTKPGDPDFDKGYCDQDRRHLASLTLGIDTPQFSNTALRAIASGWNASSIVTARTGNRINIAASGDPAFTGIRSQRPNQVSDNVYGGTLTNWFNASAFAQPAPGTYGNVKRNAFTGPNYWSVDLALARTLSLAGPQQLELRLETFNLLNTFNWGDPGVGIGGGGFEDTLNTGTFGRITRMNGDPRIIQLGVKYAF